MFKKKEKPADLFEQEEINRLKAEKEVLRKKYSDLEIKYEGLKKENIELGQQLDAVMRSTSWKFAMPVRGAKKLFILFKNYLLKPAVYQRAFVVYKNQGLEGITFRIKNALSSSKKNISPTEWLNYSLPSPAMLVNFSLKKWPASAPKFSIVMCVYNTKHEWLSEAITSVLAQVYSNWELVIVNDNSSDKEIEVILKSFASRDSRIKVINNTENLGISRSSNVGLKNSSGEYILFMDHDDYIEPHALYRFAEAAVKDEAEIIYSDEVITSEDIKQVNHVVLRPAFSYDYYISHPYFVHMVGVKKDVLNKIGGFDENLKVSHDYDLVLRAIEQAKKITHVPDVLYRWRTHASSLGHGKMEDVTKASKNALKQHANRLGFDKAEVSSGLSFNFYDVDFNAGKKGRIAIIIPTKNGHEILKKCIDSLEITVPKELADIYVINHDSNEPESIRYIESLEPRHTVLKYSGKFNFSKLINFGVANVKGDYSHYLILNNDIEALEPGWLEHMQMINARKDVGIVGSILLYPNRDVQHGGVVVGIYGVAEHAHKFDPYYVGENISLGYNGALQARRDYSAVTAACLLISADVYREIGGFDEKLEVGFGDTDLCLRTVAAGYKVVMDPHAVLIHHESYTRGKSVGKDPHPGDTRIFMQRYHELLKKGDPFYSPQLYINSPRFVLSLKF